MTAVYSAYQVQVKLDGSNWTDITADVITDAITFNGGVLGSQPLDRVGHVGEMSFTLNNNETNSAGLAGYYIPGHVNCRTGFDVGLPVRLVFTYDGRNKTKFYGEIPSDGIEVQTGRYSARRVKVKVKDWMHQAEIHELVGLAVAQGKTIQEVVALVLANMEKQPLATDYRTGSQSYDNVGDTQRSTTRAMTEFGKVAIAELGYIFITHKLGDEVLRVEGRDTRKTEVPVVSSIPIDSENSPYLTDEDGAILTDEDGAYLLADIVDHINFDNNFVEMTAPYGAAQYNRIKSTAYPRITDAAATTILFSLNSPVEVAAGATVTFTGRYRHPTGLYNNVAGMDMKTPMTTPGEYTMFANSDGTGTDLSADFTVTPTYGGADVSFVVTNNGATKGYITKCDAVGRGIYTPDPVDFIAEDAASIAKVGPVQLTMDMKYQDDPTYMEAITRVMLAQIKDAKVLPDKLTFIPNRNSSLMNAFLYLEPGDRIRVLEEVTNTEADFFINGMEASLQPGGLVKCTWYIKNAAFDMLSFAEWDEGLWDTDLWAL